MTQLSVGQQQRVAAARALIGAPELAQIVGRRLDDLLVLGADMMPVTIGLQAPRT